MSRPTEPLPWGRVTAALSGRIKSNAFESTINDTSGSSAAAMSTSLPSREIYIRPTRACPAFGIGAPSD